MTYWLPARGWNHMMTAYVQYTRQRQNSMYAENKIITNLHGSCIYSRLIVSNEQNAERGQQEVNLWVASMSERGSEKCAAVPQVYVLGHLKFSSCIVCSTLFLSEKNSPYKRTRSKSINLLFWRSCPSFSHLSPHLPHRKRMGAGNGYRKHYHTAKHFPQYQI